MNTVVKGLFAGWVVGWGAVSFAGCELAASTTSAEFCTSFKAASECHCIDSGLPRARCANIDLVYKTMMDTLGTIQRACAYQRYISSQECIDGWNCYRYGGFTSNGQLCSGTGHACG